MKIHYHIAGDRMKTLCGRDIRKVMWVASDDFGAVTCRSCQHTIMVNINVGDDHHLYIDKAGRIQFLDEGEVL